MARARPVLRRPVPHHVAARPVRGPPVAHEVPLERSSKYVVARSSLRLKRCSWLSLGRSKSNERGSGTRGAGVVCCGSRSRRRCVVRTANDLRPTSHRNRTVSPGLDEPSPALPKSALERVSPEPPSTWHHHPVRLRRELRRPAPWLPKPSPLSRRRRRPPRRDRRPPRSPSARSGRMPSGRPPSGPLVICAAPAGRSRCFTRNDHSAGHSLLRQRITLLDRDRAVPVAPAVRVSRGSRWWRGSRGSRGSRRLARWAGLLLLLRGCCCPLCLPLRCAVTTRLATTLSRRRRHAGHAGLRHERGHDRVRHDAVTTASTGAC